MYILPFCTVCIFIGNPIITVVLFLLLLYIGVNHDEFVQNASSSFEGVSTRKASEKQKSLYIGGNIIVTLSLKH